MEEKVVVKRPPKSPFLAGVLAFFFPFGAGQLYNNQYRKALVFFFIFTGLVTVIASSDGDAGQPFLGLTLAGFIIYQLFDAVQTAGRINRGALKGEEEILGIEEVPEFVKTGSIFWGIVLVALGAMLIFANFELMSYDTVFEFLIPFAILVVGLKLVVDHYSKSRKEE
jgi:TM2 domain-containing membrane protein YozV